MSTEAENTHEEPQDDLTAEQILKRMGEVYATCIAYEDAGVVESLGLYESRQWFQVKPFTTVFKRPERFCYEYKHDKTHCIIWANGKRVKTRWAKKSWSIGKLSRLPLTLIVWLFLWFTELIVRYAYLFTGRRNLNLALGAVTGVSSGSAHNIPALLLPDEVTGRYLTRLDEAVRIEDRVLEDIDCFCIQGKFASRSTLLWIDRATFLIRRIDEQWNHKSEKMYFEQTTTYYPIVNQPIDPRKFEFRPSRKRAD